QAAAAEQNEHQSVLAVTVLTSLTTDDLQEVSISGDLEDQVQRLAKLSINSGVKGLVCSPHEVADLRKLYPQATLVTPGIRLTPGADDQRRTLTLQEALKAGASLAVVGRALTAASD